MPDGREGPTIPVVLAVDVEPDGPGQVPAPPGPWPGTLASHAWLAGERDRIAELTGRAARFTWTLRSDAGMAEVYGSAMHAADAHADLVEDARAHGDELGVHVHGWRREPDGWVDDFSDPGWFAHCLAVALDAFAGTFGRPCRTSRIGNRFSSEAAFDQLAAAGVAYDLTAEPACTGTEDGAWEHVRGAMPDYRRTPRRPHRLRPGLTEVPLTAGSKRHGRDLHRHLSRMRRHGLLERLDLPVHFGKEPPPGDDFATMIRRSLRAQRRPYLCFAVRSDGMVDPVQQPRLSSHLEQLLAMPEAPRFAFVTPA